MLIKHRVYSHHANGAQPQGLRSLNSPGATCPSAWPVPLRQGHMLGTSLNKWSGVIKKRERWQEGSNCEGGRDISFLDQNHQVRMPPAWTEMPCDSGPQLLDQCCPRDSLQWQQCPRSTLSSTVATSHTCLLSTWNVASVSEELNFYFVPLKIKLPHVPRGYVTGQQTSTTIWNLSLGVSWASHTQQGPSEL